MDIFVSVWKPCKLFISFYDLLWMTYSFIFKLLVFFLDTSIFFWLSNHYIGKRLLLFDDIACPLKTTFQKIDIFTPGELPFRFFFGRARFLHIAGIPRAERSWGVVFPPRISCWKAGTPTNHRIERENHLPNPPLLGSIGIFSRVFFRFRCLESPSLSLREDHTLKGCGL